ncbi:YeeE/YedE thiosulfate transporter family protein [Craterilacuibacter sp. RT1T]|uniref:YeeE/YedE family protein n=1 Tax=Craterilacuibacter sp. RT1T TaxID=2942211 RepID=UPI0020BE6549|nr:YeeE/YedE thiosulfate transporter family protein [Craterilacuibacter sp. RT1T]MCL6263393.1 YeeE/YedE family protein [Craterilacuibacter sp. RT1T]
MSIAWDVFTPAAALGGGVLIGLAASAFVLLLGRIAGISGMLGGVLERAADWPLRLAFVLGLLAAPMIYALLAGAMPLPVIEASTPTLLLAGLLVGVGTRFASGCTSGHGVCGLSRLSPRSLVATLCFMGAGFATVYIVRHLLG